MTDTYEWQRLYEAAILETDASLLAERIQAAQKAINARIEELQSDHGGSSHEQLALADAMTGLNILRREVS